MAIETSAPASPLDRPAQFLKGVGPTRAELLARLGIHTARDLLFHIPRRYEDASTVTPIARLSVGQDATVIGEVISKGVLPTRTRLRVFQAVVRDESGSVECAWPGQPFLDRVFDTGDVVLITGPVRYFHGRRLQLQPREYVHLGRADQGGGNLAGKVLPIYPATEGLSQRMIRSLIDAHLDALLEYVAREDPLPESQRRGAGVARLDQALALLHRPASLSDAERGRTRLAYDELFFLQLLHARARERAARARPGIAFRRRNDLVRPAYRQLPFELTRAQTRAISEIFADMTSPRRMHRLLQGDVGSGKTVVALFAMLLAVENSYQAALMAPTEILAEQHARTIAKLLEGLPVNVALLTGGLPTRERREVLESMASGNAHIVVGTHALIQDAVAFRRLGLAVVDEQHRFGVRQRVALADMGENPDLLVMSATPIPRSLALTLYGDLDLSILDERPAGRKPVRTSMAGERARDRIYQFIRKEVARGRQAYIVFPLVEESEKVDLRAATAEYERLAGETFVGLRLGLLHGQLSGEEKDRVMRDFAAGELDVLVATTVIEVGIDVPNATVMVVEHAERFGLSQLHQLRGRIGRGGEQSYCILIASGESRARLRTLVETDDGFAIAQEDLRLRGMGDFFGARQHGLPEFRYVDFMRDHAILERARQDAAAIVALDAELTSPAHRGFRAILSTRYAERERLYDVG